METQYFYCNCWYVEKAGADINGNAKYKVYAYNENANIIIKGTIKEYLHNCIGSNDKECKIGYRYDKHGDFKIVSVDRQ